MDSEHRHELEENALANWLGDKVERLKPHFPTIGLGLIVLLAAPVAWSVYQRTTSSAKAERWTDFTMAMEGQRPSLALLREASDANAGTPVAEWASITWADGRLWEASQQYLRNRSVAQEAADEAIAAYESLQSASDPALADRAAYGLARAYELTGDLGKAREQYNRVTGAFAELAAKRAAELDSDRVAEDYAWLTSVGGDASTSTPAAEGSMADGAPEPDDLALPGADEEEASIDDLLEGVGDEDDGALFEEAPEDAGPALIEDTDAETDAP